MDYPFFPSIHNHNIIENTPNRLYNQITMIRHTNPYDYTL